MSVLSFAVIGGGPVGALLAHDLGRRGLSVTLFDDDKPSLPRKAGSCNIRSMEHLRRFGLVEDVKAAFPRVTGSNLDVVFATGFNGYEVHRFERALGWAETPHSAEVTQMIPQKTLNKVILRRIRSWEPTVTIMQPATVTSVSQDESGVTVCYEGGDHQRQRRFDYAIGCDGGSSLVRKAIGVKLEGEASTARNLRILFSAPWLYEMGTLAFGQQLWLISDKTNAQFNWGRGYQDNDWFAVTLWWVDDDLEAEVRADPELYLNKILGIDLPIDVKLVDVWNTHNLVANSFRKDRVFLAGDAVHLHPPTGGLGLNTGIGDVADLGWKLAAFAEGWGGPSLLDSYEAERRASALRVVGQANHNYKSGAPADYYEPGVDQDGPQGDAVRSRVKQRIIKEKQDEFYSPGLVLGNSYEDSPVIILDNTPTPARTVIEYQPCARPGHRLPHIMIDGKPIFSLLTEGMNLITVGNVDLEAVANANLAAKALGVPFSHIAAGEEAYPLYQGRFLLVRPDHYVCWRSTVAADSWSQILLKVTGRTSNTNAH